MKVYIAGPMRGIAEFNFPAFMAAEKDLESRGHEVFNPARRDVEVHGAEMFEGTTGDQNEVDAQGFLIREAMQADMEFIARHADAVVVLPNWQGSKGATAEVALARALDLPVYTLDTFVNGGFALDLDKALEDAERVQHPALAAVQEAPRWGAVGTLSKIDPPIAGVEPGSTVWVGIREDGPAGVHHVDPPREAPMLEPDENTAYWMASHRTPIYAEEFEDPIAYFSDEGEVRSVNATTGAEKGTKLARYDLIPAGPLEELAKHYGRGSRKYADRNWEKGYEWSKSFAALNRHLWAFWNRENIDPETGSPHLAAVAWHAFAMLEYTRTHPELDDRPE